MKGQVLADFLAEVPHVVDPLEVAPTLPLIPYVTVEGFWTLFVDETLGEEGAGVGILLIDPDGAENTHALRLDFRASNNESEYEALIACLQLAIKLRVQKIKVYSDSQLVVNQIHGSYGVKEITLPRYLEKVYDLSGFFLRIYD